jgi:hypothetical protein
VAECKIWDGPAVVTAAIGQLLSYLSWSDTRGALLLFIRNANVTDVIRKAIEAIEAQPCYVRTLPAAGPQAVENLNGPPWCANLDLLRRCFSKWP